MSRRELVIVARLVRGDGSPSDVVFREGEQGRPFSVGSQGTWQIAAPGVEGVHAFLFFDGENPWLFGASSEMSVWLDGHVVGETWTPVGVPSTVTLGEAEIQMERVELEVPDDDSWAHPRVEEAADDPPRGDAPRLHHVGAWRRVLAGGSSRRRIAIGLLLSFLVVVVAIRRRPAASPPPSQPRAVVGAAASAAMQPPLPSPASAVTQGPAESTPSPRDLPARASPLEPLGEGREGSLSNKSKSAERRAADAVAEGNRSAALRLYEQLARTRPDQPAFAEARRILRARARAAGP